MSRFDESMRRWRVRIGNQQHGAAKFQRGWGRDSRDTLYRAAARVRYRAASQYSGSLRRLPAAMVLPWD